MEFGIILEVSVPRPFEVGIEAQVYANSLEQVRLADELGFAQVWAVEHHFLEEYSHCSAPELLLTACAMQTSRIRLGHGIVVCVPEFNHPVRIAERIAVLDILSNGRVDVGTGRSSTWTELGGFNANPDDTKKTWDEYVHVLPKMWTQERFSHQGRAFSMPERSILPKPVQKPHPPLWVAVTSPGTELDAADRGMGSFGLSFGGFADQEERITRYRSRIQHCEPVGSFVNERVATVNFLMCNEDMNAAAKRGRQLSRTFGYLAAQQLFAKEAFPSRSYPTAGLLPALRRDASGPGDLSGVPEGVAIGDPDRLVTELRRWEAVGVDQVNFILNCMEVVPQQEVLDSLRLFAAEVMPKFCQPRTIAEPLTATAIS